MLAVKGGAGPVLTLVLVLGACEPSSDPVSEGREGSGVEQDSDGVSAPGGDGDGDGDGVQGSAGIPSVPAAPPAIPGGSTGADGGQPSAPPQASTPPTPAVPPPAAGGTPSPPATDPPAPPPPSEPLVTDPCSVTGCPDGLVCLDEGYCATPGPECRVDGDCSGNQTCGQTGVCLGSGACRVDGDCAGAESCVAMVCERGTDCGQTELTIEPIVPNVLVLLDISGSMDGQLPGGQTKIAVAKASINQMLNTFSGRIRWGAAFFPSDGACGAPTNVIPPGANNEIPVELGVQVVSADGATPINASINQIQAANYLRDPNHPNYLLLISDGGETCEGQTPRDMVNQDTRNRIGQMFSRDNIGTFVVGFGNGVDVNWLNQFANAGGYPNTAPGSNAFYAAGDATALETALGTILGSVIGCDFALTQPPADPNEVYAFFDDVILPRDDPNGWVLDLPNSQVTFQGDACTRLRNNQVTDIDVVFGCPQPVLE